LSGFGVTQLSVGLPTGWCISTIGRLQINSPGAIPQVEELQCKLRTIAELYTYPPASLHLSLLGCTQREEDKQTADRVRVNRIGRTVESVIRAHRPVRMQLGRLNLLGARFFIEVIPDSDEWSRMRDELSVDLKKIGERPVSYADTDPIHLSVARILTTPDKYLLESALTDPHLTVDETVIVDKIELVLTDFVVSPEHLEVLDIISLTG
jgi:hypothetical protein